MEARKGAQVGRRSRVTDFAINTYVNITMPMSFSRTIACSLLSHCSNIHDVTISHIQANRHLKNGARCEMTASNISTTFQTIFESRKIHTQEIIAGKKKRSQIHDQSMRNVNRVPLLANDIKTMSKLRLSRLTLPQ